MGVGALTDFGPMLRNLRLSIFGAAAQLGIFAVLLVAILMGFTPKEAASLGIIGGADGPTAIFTTIKLANLVLRLLQQQQVIDQELYDMLSARPLGVQPRGGVISPQPAFM